MVEQFLPTLAVHGSNPISSIIEHFLPVVIQENTKKKKEAGKIKRTQRGFEFRQNASNVTIVAG